MTIKAWLISPSYAIALAAAVFSGGRVNPIATIFLLTVFLGTLELVSDRWNEVVHKVDEHSRPATFALWLRSTMKLVREGTFLIVGLLAYIETAKGVVLEARVVLEPLAAIGLSYTVLRVAGNSCTPRSTRSELGVSSSQKHRQPPMRSSKRCKICPAPFDGREER